MARTTKTHVFGCALNGRCVDAESPGANLPTTPRKERRMPRFLATLVPATAILLPAFLLVACAREQPPVAAAPTSAPAPAPAPVMVPRARG